AAAADDQHYHGGSDADTNIETGTHGISDAALDTTVATLHRLCGLIDPAAGKLALKDKRYRSLRKVLYELQSSSGMGAQTNTTLSTLLNSESIMDAAAAPLSTISSSKMTHEISAQIENGAWELAVTTLRNVRKLQEEYSNQSAQAKHHANNGSYLRPKLGAVQRWVRQIDAAGTDDPLAVQVLDAILRVVAPEAIIPVEEVDMEKATWARLGVNNVSSDGNGNHLEGGSIRLFPPFDRRLKGNISGEATVLSKVNSESQGDMKIVDTLVSCMKVGKDGVRQIASNQLKDHRDALFRKCGYERGKDRRPPNRYDLDIVTTSSMAETKTLECSDASSIDTYSGEHILLDTSKGLPVVKTPLPYVQDSFLLENVLSPAECDRLIASAETAGYHPDEPLAGQPGASILAHACVFVVDHQLERTIFERVKEFLPSYEQTKQKQDLPDIETFKPLGLNRRFRFYRYLPGRYYRPHIDGAWPPSGFDRNTGRYRYDVCDEENKNGLQFVQKVGASSLNEVAVNEDSPKKPGNEKASPGEEASPDATNNIRRQLSRLTFLLYLNDDFECGHTTFLIPAKEKEGILNAFPTNPVRGGVLVFPHGTCAAPLHEGSPVIKRCKYVVRTEVEYYV
ncbi:hypothetical protein ACHAXR_010349, partial [Thalassiosira sp. AJA248-18]